MIHIDVEKGKIQIEATGEVLMVELVLLVKFIAKESENMMSAEQIAQIILDTVKADES